MTIGGSLVIFDVEGILVDSTALTLCSWQEKAGSARRPIAFTTSCSAYDLNFPDE
jgi:hypothetical protein